jgi:hypothetical protein
MIDIDELVGRAVMNRRMKEVKPKKTEKKKKGKRGGSAPKYDEDFLREIAKAYDEGMAWRDIEKKFNVSTTLIRKAVAMYSEVGFAKRRENIVKVRSHRNNILVTVPLHLAKRFNITVGKKVRWVVEKGKLVLEVVDDEQGEAS